MKKTLISIFLFCIPISVFAEIEFFLSTHDAEYKPNIWTSDSYPDAGSHSIGIRFTPSLAPVPKDYIVVDTVVEEFFQTIVTQSVGVSSSSEEIEQYSTQYYETLLSTEHPQFIEYITTSINPEVQETIEEKLEQNIVLTPFEETFYTCNISLEERQAIVLDVLDRIESGEIESIENISYSDPKFGDCIIPFPDVSHRDVVIENSFTSNQVIAKNILGEETEYTVHESVSTLIQQESEYQSSLIENEVQYSHLLESQIIRPSQYKKIQDITRYYQDTISQVESSSHNYEILVEEFRFMQERNTAFLDYLSKGIISIDQYDTFLSETEKLVELQRYFYELLNSGEISYEEYNAYLNEGNSYLKNKIYLIESFKNKEIDEKEFNIEITSLEEKFLQRYAEYSEYFTGSYKEKRGGNSYNYVIIFVFLSIFGLFIWSGLYAINYKNKHKQGEKY